MISWGGKDFRWGGEVRWGIIRLLIIGSEVNDPVCPSVGLLGGQSVGLS